MAETTASIAALAIELKQHIFSYVLLEGRLEPCLQDFLRLRLVCKAWNTAIQTGHPISFRVRIETAQHFCDEAALAHLPTSPYSFPLLANCHHPKRACALANVKICKSTWAAIETHEQLSDMLERLIASVSGLKVEVTDWIVNASRCLPVKPFIEAYEDSFSDENQQEQDEEEDEASWLTPVVEKANKKTLPPLNLYKAVKTSGYINWGEGENDEGPYGYGVFTHLKQLYIAEDDKYFNTSFTACPHLECLRIESGSHMFDFEFPTLLNACTKLKHVSYAEFDYHLPDADHFETPAAYALESIGLSARGYVDPTSIQHFTSLLETNRAYLQSLGALKMVVVDAGDGGGDIGMIPKTQKAVVALLDSFSRISSLKTVLFTNVCEMKHASLVQFSETYSKFQVLLEFRRKNYDLSSTDGNEGDDVDGDDDQDNGDEDDDDGNEDDDDNGDEDKMDDDEDILDEDEGDDDDASISLKGRTLVFTGTLSQMTRAVAATRAKQCGATVASSLTKAVDLVVNAGDGGAKLEKARDQGVEIWDENKFMRALETNAAEDMQHSNIEPSQPSSTLSSSKSAPKKLSLQGKTVTFTGTLASLPRAEAAQKAVEHGAAVASSLTKAVNLVISSKSDGSVLEKARERGIDVWTEDEFLEVVSGTASSISQKKTGKRGAKPVVDVVVDVGELNVSKEKQGANRRKPAKPVVEVPALSVSKDDKVKTEQRSSVKRKAPSETSSTPAHVDPSKIDIAGRNIVFTGTLQLMKRAEATKHANLLDATVHSSFNESIDLVVAGGDAGAKLDKARAQGVEIWDEQTFLDVLAGSKERASFLATKVKKR